MNLGNGGGEEKSALEQYGVDLTSKAREGKLDPVIGRDSVCRFYKKTVGPLRHIAVFYFRYVSWLSLVYYVKLAMLTPDS